MKLRILLLFILSLCLINPTYSLEEKKNIRVGISDTSFSTWNHQSTQITSDNQIIIVDMSSNTKFAPIEALKTLEIKISDNLFNISIDNKLTYENVQGPLLLSSNSKLQIIELNRKGKPAKYDGMFEITPSKNNANSFNIINVIDLDNYLRGVVPNEMPVSFGQEALKAQAIVARNYVQNSKISPNYDVVDSTASQVYYGANSYKDLSDNAIKKTNGIYALYNNKPISALYFSTSPGITDDWDDVFGNGQPSDKHPYLKAKYDKIGQTPLKTEKEVIDFYSKKDNGLDINSPKFRWTYEFTRKEIEEILHTTLQQQSKIGNVTPKYDGDEPLVGLKEIKALKRTQSGKITQLQICAKSGNYVVKKELAIRKLFKKGNQFLPTSNFFIITSGLEKLEDNSSENNQNTPELIENTKDNKFLEIKLFDAIDLEKYPSIFKITGGGFGHNVGMSQFGAYNLAKTGKKYPDILKYYYTDIYLSTIPKTVLFNEYNVWYKNEFYFDSSTFKNAYLYINNSKGVSEFPFKINDLEFNSTSEIARNRVVKINITEYLKDGKNIINFAPLTSANKGKYITYQVEFK